MTEKLLENDTPRGEKFSILSIPGRGAGRSDLSYLALVKTISLDFALFNLRLELLAQLSICSISSVLVWEELAGTIRYVSSAYFDNLLTLLYLGDRVHIFKIKLIGPKGEPWITLLLIGRDSDSTSRKRVVCFLSISVSLIKL